MVGTRLDETVEIREVPGITPEEATQLTGWGDNIFGTAHLQLRTARKRACSISCSTPMVTAR